MQGIGLKIADHLQPVLRDRRPGLGRMRNLFRCGRIALLVAALAFCGGFFHRHGIGDGGDFSGARVDVMTDGVGFFRCAPVPHRLRRQFWRAIGVDG